MSKSPDITGHDAVVCSNVRKEFYVYKHRTSSLREFFIRALSRRQIHERRATFMLEELSLRVAHGESVALVGRNGSGKSTALRLMAGIYRPTSGVVETRGRLAAVLELGVGFSPDLTGAENISIKGAIMGLTSRQIAARRDEILEFAEIGDFINMPLKYYSSGMRSRLAFAIVFCIKPDILLLDEVFAVGDEAFVKKCQQRIYDFLGGGGTMVLASHAAPLVRQLCTRAIWLEEGKIRMDGNADDVLDAYLASTTSTAAANPSQEETDTSTGIAAQL